MFFVVFADARQKIEDPIGRYFTESNLYKVWSFMTLPVTLPIDLTYAITKRYVIEFLYRLRFNESMFNPPNIHVYDERVMIEVKTPIICLLFPSRVIHIDSSY